MPKLCLPPRVAILGAGAIGQLIGGALFQADKELAGQTKTQATERTTACSAQINQYLSPLYITRDQTYIHEMGMAEYSLLTYSGDTYQYQALTSTLSGLENNSIEQLIICTKAHNTIDAFISIQPKISPTGSITLLQNGLGNHEKIAQLLDQIPEFLGRLFLASTTEAAKKTSANSLQHTGIGEIHFGLYKSYTPDPNEPTLDHPFHHLKNTAYTQDIERILWRKLMVNCAINPLTVKFNCLNGDLLNIEEAISLIRGICKEAALVAEKLGKFNGESSEEISESAFKNVLAVLHNTHANSSSMREDVLKGRETEIAYINGYLVKLARQHSLDAPLNITLTSFINDVTARGLLHDQ